MAFLSANTENNKIPLVNHTLAGYSYSFNCGNSFQRYFEAVISRLHVEATTRLRNVRNVPLQNYCIINIVAQNSLPLRIYQFPHQPWNSCLECYRNIVWKYNVHSLLCYCCIMHNYYLTDVEINIKLYSLIWTFRMNIYRTQTRCYYMTLK